MSETYPGFVYGDLRIPCHVYQSGVFRLEDVLCKYDSAELILPEDIAAFKDELIKKKKIEAEKRGAPFYDDPMVRLRDYGVKIEDPRTEKLNLILTFQPSSWFTYVSTNMSLDEKILRDECGRKVSIREKYIKYPLDLNDVLANPTGVSATIISEPDHRILIAERSMKLAQYPGLYGDAAAGFMKDTDVIDGTPNPFKTIQRESGEELGLKPSINDFKLLGVGRAMDDLHGEIWGELRTPLTIQEIYSTPKKDKYEHLRLFDVPFEPKEVLKYVSRTIEQIPPGVSAVWNVWKIDRTPKWVPGHTINTIQSLEREYGYERVMRELKNL